MGIGNSNGGRGILMYSSSPITTIPAITITITTPCFDTMPRAHAHARLLQTFEDQPEAVDIPKVVVAEERDGVLDCVLRGNHLLHRRLLEVPECLLLDAAVLENGDEWAG